MVDLNSKTEQQADDDLTWLARNVPLEQLRGWVQKAGEWFNIIPSGMPPAILGQPMWFSAREVLTRKGEVLGDWRDTLERRPADPSGRAITERLTEATQTVLSAAPALMDEKYHFAPEFKPVNVNNETVPMGQPTVTIGTGGVTELDAVSVDGANELAGKLAALLKIDAWGFDSSSLFELHQLCDAELTKRDAAVCGGKKHLDDWHKRGELPPAGEICVLHAKENNGEKVMFIGITSDSFPVFETFEKRVFVERGEYRFSPIQSERERVASELVDVMMAVPVGDRKTPSESFMSMALAIYDHLHQESKS